MSVQYFLHEGLHIAQTGNPQGVTVVALHGLGGDHAQLMPLLATNPAYCWYFPDLPGHGQSPLLEGTQSIMQFARQVGKVLDTLPGPVVLIGLSMGAAISLRLALDLPGKIARVCLVRPAWVRHPNPPNLSVLVTLAGYLNTHPDRESAKMAFLKDPAYIAVQQAVPGAAMALLHQFDAPDLAIRARLLKEIVASAPLLPEDNLETIKLPVWVVKNERDPLHPDEMANFYQAALPHCQVRTVAPRYTQPRAHEKDMLAVIRSFLERT
jgi:pimeloyl-ACP methyl ester carboxylesterase